MKQFKIQPWVNAQAPHTQEDAAARWATFWDEVEQGKHPAFGPVLQPLPQDVLGVVQGWGQTMEHVLWLGLGGSTLGAQALQQWVQPAGGLKGPRVHFLDHLCPAGLGEVLVNLPLEKTALVVISKSGTTLETTTQLTLFETAFKAANIVLSGRVVVVTEPTQNPLQAFAKTHRAWAVEHPAALGGRYSVFGPTGQLLLALRGVDGAALLRGAQVVRNEVYAAPDAFLQAALPLCTTLPMHVMYAYGQPLKMLPFWWCQLWAESLGKAGKGVMPIAASGPADQHSVQQLFMGGPNDKLYTVVVPTSTGQGPAVLGQPPVGTLQRAMANGTCATLAARGRMHRVIELDDRNVEALGGLLMQLMLEVVAVAAHQNTNPFDQPDVEASKMASRAALQSLLAT
jgi:glucose-6-phosphate isomerase